MQQRSNEALNEFKTVSKKSYEDRPIPVLIVVPANEIDYIDSELREKSYFGYRPVILLPNDHLACTTREGKILLNKDNRIKIRTCGNGGVFNTFKKHDVVKNFL